MLGFDSTKIMPCCEQVFLGMKHMDSRHLTYKLSRLLVEAFVAWSLLYEHFLH